MSHHPHHPDSEDPTFLAKSRSTSEVLRRVATYLRPYKLMAAGTVACALFSMAFSLAYPKLAQFIIDEVIGHKRIELLTPMMLAVLGAFLLRDLFNSPFRPVAFSPEWRTPTVVALAQQIYHSRNFAPMPILADALQDAGCEHAAILDHCRDPHAAHVRGCWVVDLVLGQA